MSETDKFLAAIMPRLTEAETALINGDASQRIAMWSHDEPVTLFGAAATRTGWAEARHTFEQLGAIFSDCSAYEIEVVAAGASGDLAYLVAFEHVTASVNGVPSEPFTLRVTAVFRREDGEWRVVHRHGDSPESVAGHQLAGQLQASDRLVPGPAARSECLFLNLGWVGRGGGS